MNTISKTVVNNSKNVSFGGIKGSGKALFVFDLDGSFLQGINRGTLNDFSLLQQDSRAVLSYATGQNLQKFTETKLRLGQNGVHLPSQKFLLARNGLFVYKDENGQLLENEEWKNRVLGSFQAERIRSSVKKLVSSSKDLMTDLGKSKLCEYEFWGAPGRMIQFAVDFSISGTILQSMRKHLKEEDINARVMKQSFSKEVCDKLCTPEQLEIINPLYGQSDRMTQLDILAANKGDATEFIQKKLGIPDEEVLMVGNDENDISMAKLAKRSARNFVCLDKTGELFQYVNQSQSQENILIPKQEGILGIIESLKKILDRKSKK